MSIYSVGQGASAEGDRPFLDRLNLKTLAAERLFRSDETQLRERRRLLLDDQAAQVADALRRRADRPPNYFVRDIARRRHAAGHQLQGSASADHRDGRAHVRDLQAQGRRAAERHDLPAAWLQEGRRACRCSCGRIRASSSTPTPPARSPDRRTASRTVTGASHLLLLTQGYAIFDGPTMPIVGPGETANDNYVEQLVASAQAAVDKAVEIGIADRAPHRRRRPQLRRVHDGEPAGALGHLRRRRRAQRRLQPHADAVRLPGRDAHVLGGAGGLRDACRRSATRTRSRSRSC